MASCPSRAAPGLVGVVRALGIDYLFTHVVASRPLSTPGKIVTMDRVYRPGRRAGQTLVVLRSLASVSDGGELSELDHALQVATRAERAGADGELIVAALVHDIGKVFGDAGHGEIAAALLAPHIRPDVVAAIRHHTAFTARHWRSIPPGEVDPRTVFAAENWYELACRFADEWDMQSFDPHYDSHPLEHFKPLVEKWIKEP